MPAHGVGNRDPILSITSSARRVLGAFLPALVSSAEDAPFVRVLGIWPYRTVWVIAVAQVHFTNKEMTTMTTNFQRNSLWLQACEKRPGDFNALSVQIGCHIEELAEFLSELMVADSNYDAVLQGAIGYLRTVSTAIKTGTTDALIQDENRENALKELCDCEVTGNGVAFLAGFDKDAADAIVISSNEDKLVDGQPVILPGGKIGKRPGWQKPSLASCI